MVRIDVSDTGVGMSAGGQLAASSSRSSPPRRRAAPGWGWRSRTGIVQQRGGQPDVRARSRPGDDVHHGAAAAPGSAPAAKRVGRSRRLSDADERRTHPVRRRRGRRWRSFVQRLLLIEGFHVTICSGGEEALGRRSIRSGLRSGAHRLRDAGPATAWRSRRRSAPAGPRTPVVLMTAWGSDLDSLRSPPASSDVVIGKPFRLR